MDIRKLLQEKYRCQTTGDYLDILILEIRSSSFWNTIISTDRVELESMIFYDIIENNNILYPGDDFSFTESKPGILIPNPDSRRYLLKNKVMEIEWDNRKIGARVLDKFITGRKFEVTINLDEDTKIKFILEKADIHDLLIDMMLELLLRESYSDYTNNLAILKYNPIIQLTKFICMADDGNVHLIFKRNIEIRCKSHRRTEIKIFIDGDLKEVLIINEWRYGAGICAKLTKNIIEDKYRGTIIDEIFADMKNPFVLPCSTVKSARSAI